MKNNLLTLWLILVLVVEIFILIPVSIYLGNSQEFLTPIFVILKWYATPALGVIFVLFVISIFLKKEKLERYHVLLSALGLLIWVHGFVLIWNYGILNGDSKAWSISDMRGVLDFSIWVVVLTVSLLYYKKIKNTLLQLTSFVFLVQFFYLSLLVYNQKIDINKQENAILSVHDLQNIYSFSPEFNVLHLMLDGFQSDVFNELMQDKLLGPQYQKNFNGFTYFDETLSLFPYTRFSVATFISGKIYQNNVPKDDFNRSVFKGHTIFNSAYSKGLEVDFVSEEYWIPFLTKGNYTNTLILSSDTSGNFQLSNSAKLFDLTLFRIVPHYFKKYIYNDQEWLFSSIVSSKDNDYMQHGYFFHTQFLKKLIKNLKVKRKSPVYKYMHIMNTHNPMVVNSNCDYAGGTMATIRYTLTIQSKCTLDTISELFAKMKDLGVYDNTLIIMHADHGGWVIPYRYNPDIVNKNMDTPLPNAAASLSTPLLAIKPINSNDKFKTSSVLVSLSDIPDTISSLMKWNDDFGSQSIFNLNEFDARERKFYYFKFQRDAWTSNFTGPMFEYIINGSQYDTPWLLNKIINPSDVQSN